MHGENNTKMYEYICINAQPTNYKSYDNEQTRTTVSKGAPKLTSIEHVDSHIVILEMDHQGGGNDWQAASCNVTVILVWNMNLQQLRQEEENAMQVGGWGELTTQPSI